MMNSYYSYDTAYLWDPAQWKDRYCSMYPLFKHIEYLNREKYAIPKGSGPYKGRTDGKYFPKTWSVTYPETVKMMEALGLQFQCLEMGHLCWITITPETVVKKCGSSPRVIVVQQSVDYSDHNWAMNVLDKYSDYQVKAAREGLAVIFSCAETPDKDNLLSSLIQEYGTRFSVSLEHLYLDVSNLLDDGQKLKNVPGFLYRDKYGNELDPDEAVEDIAGIPVLEMTGRWQNRVSNLWGTAMATRSVHKSYDLEKLKHTICGKRMTQEMVLEHEYDDAEQPELLAYWNSIGLNYHSHLKNGQRWIFIAPDCTAEQSVKDLPTMVIFREVSHNNGYLPLIALAGFYDYIDLAAQGDMNILLFVLEDPDSNDLLVEILQEAGEIYGVDPQRVYVTGHSHNAMYCYEFAARHPQMIAGVATEGSMHSLIDPQKGGMMNLSDRSIEALSQVDMPVLNCNGAAENHFLIHELGSPAYEQAVEGYQRRLKASRCPEKTLEEIRAAHDSASYAVRRLGVPADEAEVKFIDGVECYVGHVFNREGKERLRLVTIDNLPHITNPMFPMMSWSFLRRFARNNGTGELIELY